MITYVLGGGCFWCLDAVYRRVKGVIDIASGYAGGYGNGHPSYDAVSSGATGHAEVVQITFDDAIISADTILDIFFSIHDPTTLNHQGADIGTQYRSIMLYKGAEQKQTFEAARTRAQKLWDDPIVTQIVPLGTFYKAEDKHQDYFTKHPETGYCTVVIKPKLSKARHEYKKWFKEEK